MKKAVIYARYSSNNQREASIDQQVNACKDYCQKQNMIVVDVYSDYAMTGRTDARPNFQRMILDSQKHTFNYVVVYAIDRFSRDEYDSVTYEHILMENKVTLLSATEPFSEEPSGLLIKSFFRGYAMYYSKELSRKVQRGLDDNAKKFLAPASVPFGFNRSPTGHYVINESEAEVVREIFDRILRGDKQVDIFEDLNKRGIKTKKGAKWNKSSFNTLLTNDHYIGTHTYKDRKTEDVIPLIVDKDTFWKVQMKLRGKSDESKVVGRRTIYGNYLLTGLLYCSCGKHMIGLSGTSRNGKKVFYYQCSGKKNHSGCNRRNVKKDFIENLVAESVRNLCMDDDCIRWMAHDAVKQYERNMNLNELPTFEKRLAKIDKQIDNYVKAIGEGLLTDTMKDSIKELEEERRIIKWKIQSIEDQRKAMITEEKLIAYLTIYKDIELVNEHFRQGIIDAFVKKITLEEDKMHIDFELKKEGHQADVMLDDQGTETGSPNSAQWRCGEISRLKDFSFRYTTLVVFN